MKCSSYKSVKALVDTLTPGHHEVVASGVLASLNRFESLMEYRLPAHRADARTWTKGSYEQGFTEAMTDYEEAVEIARFLPGVLSTLKAVRLLEVRAFAGDRRKTALVVRRLLKKLAGQAYWKSLLTFFGEHCMGISASSSRLEPAESKCLAPGVIL